MNIGFDVDGVLASFYDGYERKCIEAAGGKNLFPTRGENGVSLHPVCWNWPEHYGYSAAEVSAAWKSIKNDPSFWYDCAVLDAEGVELARRLCACRDHAVYFITTRPGVTAKSQTETWLWVNGGIRIPTVLISGNKGPVAVGLNLDIFIDDKPENCMDIRLVSEKTRVFMPDRDYNRHTTPQGVERVGSVREALELAGLLQEGSWELRHAA